MGTIRIGRVAIVCALTIALSSCGGGGGGSASQIDSGSTALLTDLLEILSHSPQDDALQVPVGTSITLEFDSAIAPECLEHEDTWLREVDSGQDQPFGYTVLDSGRRLVITPGSPLQEATDYRFQLSALTCDRDGRLLEEDFSFVFRSHDSAAPTILAASIADGANDVPNTADIRIDFDEVIDLASVTSFSARLLNLYGDTEPMQASLDGKTLVLDPYRDLAGSRSYQLELRSGAVGITDRAGNVLGQTFLLRFSCSADISAPQIIETWPDSPLAQSPALEPRIIFNESIDEFSVETSSLSFVDEFANIIPYYSSASTDYKTLRLIPYDELIPGRRYTITVAGGPGAITDLSGNPLGSAGVFNFLVGSDLQAPQLLAAAPADAATRVSPNVELLLSFNEALDPETIVQDNIILQGPDGIVPGSLSLKLAGQQAAIRPDENLLPGTRYELFIRGTHEGLRDLAGNPFPADQSLSFTTSDDASTPSLQVWPRNGESIAPIGVHISILSTEPLDPGTVDSGSVYVEDEWGNPVPGTLSLLRSDRLIRFTPSSGWIGGTSYTVTMLGGPSGLREISGNWLASDESSSFRVRSSGDLIPPTVTVTVNNLADARKHGRSLPGYGFEILVNAIDPLDFSLDMASTQVELSGPGDSPDPETIFATAEVDGSNLRWILDADHELENGEYTLLARVSDLSGNQAVSPPMTFMVKTPTAEALPFERTHVVWVRFDLDRDGNGTSDFEDDLTRLGLITPGDPLGTNDYMIQVVRDGIMTQCNQLYERKANGGRQGQDSVAIRFTHRQPLGVARMQIACGGLDPEADPARTFGDASSGILGRAFYDYRNADVNDLNIGKSPGVGVFPAELFLYETRIHLQVYPSFVTSFANRFLAVCPQMGGTSAGGHAQDSVVLDPDFDPVTGTTVQNARYLAVFLAADDWATAIGTILAHEVGHSVGLVAPGTDATALHGDGSLHNSFSSSVDVMGAAVGYEALVSLDFRMRDLNLAYLRQRVLLK